MNDGEEDSPPEVYYEGTAGSTPLTARLDAIGKRLNSPSCKPGSTTEEMLQSLLNETLEAKVDKATQAAQADKAAQEAATPMLLSKKQRSVSAPGKSGGGGGKKRGSGDGGGDPKGSKKRKPASAVTYSPPSQIDESSVPAKELKAVKAVRAFIQNHVKIMLNDGIPSEVRSKTATDLVTSPSARDALKTNKSTGTNRDGFVAAHRAFLSDGKKKMSGDKLREQEEYFAALLAKNVTVVRDQSDSDQDHDELIRGLAKKFTQSAGQATSTTSVPFSATFDLTNGIEEIMSQGNAALVMDGYDVEQMTNTILTQFFERKKEICGHVDAAGTLKTERMKAIKKMLSAERFEKFAGLDIATILMMEGEKGYSTEQLAELAGVHKVLHEHMASGGHLLFVGETNAAAHAEKGRVTIDHCFLKVDGVIRYLKLESTIFGG